MFNWSSSANVGFRLGLFAGVSACLGLAAPAMAQDVAPAGAQQNVVQLEEVTVTAQKRSERLQDVPMTISVVSGKSLDQLKVNDFSEMSKFVPGLTVSETSANHPSFTIRGVNSSDTSPQLGQRVSVYLNGVDASRATGSSFDLFDIERIEVVKGPQATLFGSAAAVGAISVLTNKPTEAFSSSVWGQVGNFDNREIGGFINGGNDKIQGRLAGQYRYRSGYVKSLDSSQKDFGGYETAALRGSVQFNLASNLTALAVLSYEHNDNTGTPFKSSTVAPVGGDLSPYSATSLSVSPKTSSYFKTTQLGTNRTIYDANVNLKWVISDELSLSSITGYRKYNSYELFDPDGSYVKLLTWAENMHGYSASQEFRVNYEKGDVFKGFAGVSYNADQSRRYNPILTDEGLIFACLGLVPGLSCTNADGSVNSASAAPLPYLTRAQDTGDNKSVSVFADGAWQLSPVLHVSAGLRYVHEKRKSTYAIDNPNSLILASLGVKSPLFPYVSTGFVPYGGEAEGDSWLPRVNVRYDVQPDIHLYATISKGQRSKAMSVTPASTGSGSPVAIKVTPAETIWNYEVGAKTQWLERRLSLEIAAFYEKYENFQTIKFDPTTGTRVTNNAGSASNPGVEITSSFTPFQSLSLFANGAWTDSRIDNTKSNGVYAGRPFVQAPKWTASAGVHWERPVLADNRLSLDLNYTYRSRIYFDQEYSSFLGLALSDPQVGMIGGRLALAGGDDRWNVGLFVKNLTNAHSLIDAGGTGKDFGFPTTVRGAPRTFGIDLKSNF